MGQAILLLVEDVIYFETWVKMLFCFTKHIKFCGSKLLEILQNEFHTTPSCLVSKDLHRYKQVGNGDLRATSHRNKIVSYLNK